MQCPGFDSQHTHNKTKQTTPSPKAEKTIHRMGENIWKSYLIRDLYLKYIKNY
jgi:hypothetical protein